MRLGSEQTSGHTSGDELETTTSSDIEIISSPNGDGSSTTSRQSPAKHLQRAPHGAVDFLKFSGKIKGVLYFMYCFQGMFGLVCTSLAFTFFSQISSSFLVCLSFLHILL